jgi:Family of unknown function (DUF6491)
MRWSTAAAFVLASSLLVGFAQARDDSGDAYDRIAGPEQPWFAYARLRDWEPVGPARVVLWSDRRQRPWLVTVAPPCAALADTRILAVTSFAQRIVAGRDELIADGQRCRVRRLRVLEPTALSALLPSDRSPRRISVRPRPQSDAVGPGAIPSNPH